LRSEEILAQFSVQKSEKQNFLQNLQSYAENLGYSAKIANDGFGRQNFFVGDPSRARFMLCAGDTRSGLSLWLEILRTFPENQRHRVCFVLFDGKLGELIYRRKNPLESDQKLFIYLDRVGVGNHMRIYPTQKVKADRVLLSSFYCACGYFGTKDLLVEEKRKPFFLKTCRIFPYAVTICALQAHKKGFRYPLKKKDIHVDNTNVNILRAALTTFICRSEVQ